MLIRWSRTLLWILGSRLATEAARPKPKVLNLISRHVQRIATTLEYFTALAIKLCTQTANMYMYR